MKFVDGVAVWALVVSASSVEAYRGSSQRSLRQSSGQRILQAGTASHPTTTKTFEQFYFSETLDEDDTVTLMEAGPFKLEASCKTVVLQYSLWYSSSAYLDSSNISFTETSGYPSESTIYTNGSGTYSYTDFYTDDWTWDPAGNYTESFLALDLTYTAPEDDYLFGSPTWWYHHPNETMLVGPWEAGESRTSTVFRGYGGGWGGEFTLQSLSGNYISVDSGDTVGVHKAHSEWLPGGDASFPAGIECMVAGFFTYHIPPKHTK